MKGGLAEKWRPKVLEDVVGQDVAFRVLKATIRGGRLAPGYIFKGPFGCGKTTFAGIFSRAIGCPNRKVGDLNPCNECGICKAQMAYKSNDLRQVDAASKGSVEAIRSLRDDATYAPAEGAVRKVIIIDEAHRLSGAAWDALLEITEVGSLTTTFIFCTTEPERIPDTIRSRCETIPIALLSIEVTVKRLRYIADQEGIKIDDRALTLIARNARGHLRDAIKNLGRLHVLGITDERDARVVLGVPSRQPAFKLLLQISQSTSPGAVYETVDAVIGQGMSAHDFVDTLVEAVYDCLSFNQGLLDQMEESKEVVSPVAPFYRKDQLLGIAFYLMEVRRSKMPKGYDVTGLKLVVAALHWHYMKGTIVGFMLPAGMGNVAGLGVPRSRGGDFTQRKVVGDVGGMARLKGLAAGRRGAVASLEEAEGVFEGDKD